MSNDNQGARFFQGLFVAVGLALAGYFVSQTLYNAKVALNTAEAMGLAERRVMADRANWEIEFKVTGKSRDEIPGLYEKAERHQQTIIGILKENGFDDNEIRVGILDYEYEEFRDDKQVLADQVHRLVGTISIETEKVGQISPVRARVNKLIAQGIEIDNKAPAYLFTKLNEIKPEMLREATKNARIAANEFAENAGVEVGGIQSARQGRFDVSDAGAKYGNTAKIEKDIRVVTTITFYLTE